MMLSNPCPGHAWTFPIRVGVQDSPPPRAKEPPQRNMTKGGGCDRPGCRHIDAAMQPPGLRTHIARRRRARLRFVHHPLPNEPRVISRNFYAPAALRADRRTSRRALRDALRRAGLAGFIMPHADEYQSEYVPPYARAPRLADRASPARPARSADARAKRLVFVDGRCTLQVRDQVDGSDFAYQHLIETPPQQWLKGRLGEGDRLGFDPRLLTVTEVRRFEAAAARGRRDAGRCRSTTRSTPVWHDRPAPPLAAVSGTARERSPAKSPRTRSRALQAHPGREGRRRRAVIAQSGSIAWTFNIRGGDVPPNPVAPLLCHPPPRRAALALYRRPQALERGRATRLPISPTSQEAALAADLAALGARRKARVLADPHRRRVLLARPLDRRRAARLSTAPIRWRCPRRQERRRARRHAPAHRATAPPSPASSPGSQQTAPKGG